MRKQSSDGNRKIQWSCGIAMINHWIWITDFWTNPRVNQKGFSSADLRLANFIRTFLVASHKGWPVVEPNKSAGQRHQLILRSWDPWDQSIECHIDGVHQALVKNQFFIHQFGGWVSPPKQFNNNSTTFGCVSGLVIQFSHGKSGNPLGHLSISPILVLNSWSIHPLENPTGSTAGSQDGGQRSGAGGRSATSALWGEGRSLRGAL